MLLQSFYRSTDNLDVMFLEDSCEKFRDAFDVRKDYKVTSVCWLSPFKGWSVCSLNGLSHVS